MTLRFEPMGIGANVWRRPLGGAGLVDGQPFQMSPDQMHRFMDALKEADPGIYSAVLSKVRDLIRGSEKPGH